tara:strand:+ start:29976 stop:31814 length:1839 start_codon:yes stop_codon:yes gene_type:complete
MIQDLYQLGINLKRTSGQEKTICPKCSHTRKPKNQKEPCLSVNIDEGIYNCHHCGWNGSVQQKNKYKKPYKEYILPKYNPTDLPDNVVMEFQKRGISPSTLMANKVTCEKVYMPQKQKEVTCIIFNYFRNGQIVNKKYRTADKMFKMESGAELIFYNIDNIQDNQVVICEGEMDVLAFFEAGIRYAISVPNGASKGNNNLQYLDNCASFFENGIPKEIYIATDGDEPGTRLGKELSRRLGRERCKIVKYPDGCKDANEVLLKHGEEGVLKLITDAEFYPIKGIVPMTEIRKGTLDLFRNGVAKGDVIGLESTYDDELGLDDLVSWKTGLVYTWTGIPTHGKSSMVNQVETLLAVNCGWKFGIYSPEHLPIQFLAYRYAEIIVGKAFFHGKGLRMNEMELESALDFIEKHFFFIKPKSGSIMLDELIDLGKQLVLRHGIKGFTIDPWNKINHQYGKYGSETQYIEKALNKITMFKQNFDVAVFLVAHPRKMDKVKDKNSLDNGQYEVPTLYDISGSKSWYDMTDVGIAIYRNRVLNITTVYIQKIKWKHLGEEGMTDFKYISNCSRFYPCSKDGQKTLQLNGSWIDKEPEQTSFEDDWLNDDVFRKSRPEVPF